MAKRIVFAAYEKKPYVKAYETEFVWNKGLNVAQKRKNIAALQSAFLESYPEKNVLEISSKSTQVGGLALSAFFLKKYVPSIGKSIPVENVFQGGKIFSCGGPYKELYDYTPIDAKRSPLLTASGTLTGFCFEETIFSTEPKTAFYDYIYCNALLENPNLAEIVLSYDAFTDIEFNPKRSLNCQAKAAALFVSLARLGLKNAIKDFALFLNLTAKENSLCR